MTIIAAPITPARSPSSQATIRRFRVARGANGGRSLRGPREQVFSRVGDVAADHDDRGVEEVDDAGQYLAEHAPGVADDADGEWIAGQDQATTSRLRVADSPDSASCRARERPPATASRQPTLPQRQITSSWPVARMWPMSRRAVCATVDVAVDDHAAADSSTDLESAESSMSRQRGACSPRAMMLTSLSTSTGAA